MIFILMCAFGFILYLANRIDNKMKAMEFTLLNRMQQLQRALRTDNSRHACDAEGEDDHHAEGEDDHHVEGEDDRHVEGEDDHYAAEDRAFQPCRGGRVCD